MSAMFLLVNFNEVKKNQADDDPGQRVEHQYPQELGPVCLSFFTLLLLQSLCFLAGPGGGIIRHV